MLIEHLLDPGAEDTDLGQESTGGGWGSQERLKEGDGMMGEGRWILGGRSTICKGQVLFEKLGAGAHLAWP